ncbi:hypothetical protein ASE60_31345 [Ensifer sp. Root278]|nr:hypothetical protein ASE60_31345 [Ensifer sp. Root278]
MLPLATVAFTAPFKTRLASWVVVKAVAKRRLTTRPSVVAEMVEMLIVPVLVRRSPNGSRVVVDLEGDALADRSDGALGFSPAIIL